MILPDEAEAPLGVHPDAVLTTTIADKPLQPVARRDPETLPVLRGVDQLELPQNRYFHNSQLLASVTLMDDLTPCEPSPRLSPVDAQHLLDSMARRPRRVFRDSDHLSSAATISLSFIAGLLALSGHPWWAVLPALCAVISSHMWVNKRLSRANEPRLKATFIATVFTVWLLLPIWRGIAHGETIPFPEALAFAGLAPAAWLVFYLVLLIRR